MVKKRPLIERVESLRAYAARYDAEIELSIVPAMEYFLVFGAPIYELLVRVSPEDKKEKEMRVDKSYSLTELTESQGGLAYKLRDRGAKVKVDIPPKVVEGKKTPANEEGIGESLDQFGLGWLSRYFS